MTHHQGTARVRRRGGVVAALLLLGCAASCGKKGAPLPPLPRGPLAPAVVRARQLGPGVVVGFEIPGTRGEKPSQQAVQVELVRVSYSPGIEPPTDPGAFRRRGTLVRTETADPFAAGAEMLLVDETISELEQGGVGHTVRYGVRVRDRRSRPSPLVLAKDLVLEPPVAPPDDVNAEATVDGVRLTWAAPSGPGPFKYNLYRAAEGGPLPGRPLNDSPLTSLEYLDGEVVSGNRYRYVLRVALADGPPYRESVDSQALEVLARDLFPPAAPDGLVGVQEGAAVRLFWNPSGERDLAGYRVYRREGDSDWKLLTEEPVVQPLYLDRGAGLSNRREYRVTAVDRAMPPNESPPTDDVELELVDEGSLEGERP